MCLKARTPWPMPEDTAAIAASLLKAESVYKLVGEQLFAQFSEAEFAALYSPEGKPGYSPVILALVSVFQYLERLPDRQAAEAVRLRLDWKYALHLPLRDPGFDYSVLCEFRERLLEHQAERQIFDRLVALLRAQGLIRERGKQRTDSLAMLSKVRHLSRVELVVETLRLAVGAVLQAARSWGETVLPPAWEARYGERFVQERHSEAEWAAYEQTVGDDGQWFLAQLSRADAPALNDLPAVQVLGQVWAQQFEPVDGHCVFRPSGGYDGHTRIDSPHDPEARYSEKRGQHWVGGKLQVTDTDDAGYPHLLTDIAATSSSLSDWEALAPIQARLAERQCLPGAQYLDSGYMSGPNLERSQQRGIDLIGPVPRETSPQSRLPDGLTLEQFRLDLARPQATCPAGQTSARHAKRGEEEMRFYFAPAVCQACPLRPRCCTGQGGRSLCVGRTYPLLQAARQRQTTPAFRQDYHQHRSGVEGTLSALARGNGLRVSRYIGDRKRHLQALLGGAAANLSRAARWLAGIRPVRHHRAWQLTPQAV